MVATLPRITIKNFQSISANTPVRFQVLYVIPPAGTNTHTMKISLISLKNRIYSNLNEDIFTFTINALTTSGITTSNIVYTSNIVNTYFDVTFTPNFGAVPANSYILVMLPSYDTKFIQLDSIISCNIQTVSGNPFVSLPCISYYGVDWIMIQSSSALPSTTSIKITNLLWPRYVNTLSTTFCFQTAVFSPTTYQYTKTPSGCTSPVPSPNPQGFQLAMIAVPKKGLGYVDCSYTFTFQTQNKLPNNSQIILTFPSTYSLIDSSPAPTFTAPLLTASDGTKIQFSATTNQLTISNIGEYPANTPFTIIVTGIKNPSSGTISSGWNIDIYYNNFFVNSYDSFFSFPYGPSFTSGNVIINQITGFPLNADEYADYTIVFTPQTDIPTGGLISVTFPADNYKELPGNLDCQLSGGIQTFTSCILSSQTVNIVTGEKYSAGIGSIYLKIKNIKNPDAGTTEGFTVQTSYDGVVLDVTDESTLSGRTFTSTTKARNK